jgi:hypothetical protein
MVERYNEETNTWPSPDLNELGNPDYFPDGLPVGPFDGTTEYTIDDSTHQVNNIPNQ